MRDALQRAEACFRRLQQAHGPTQPQPTWTRHIVPPRPAHATTLEGAPQKQDGTSCGLFMACAALAILRAVRDGHDPAAPTLDYDQRHMHGLRLHFAHRYCMAIPPLIAAVHGTPMDPMQP